MAYTCVNMYICAVGIHILTRTQEQAYIHVFVYTHMPMCIQVLECRYVLVLYTCPYMCTCACIHTSTSIFDNVYILWPWFSLVLLLQMSDNAFKTI